MPANSLVNGLGDDRVFTGVSSERVIFGSGGPPSRFFDRVPLKGVKIDTHVEPD